jgi:membrane protease YdiL (CAAX protease family)
MTKTRFDVIVVAVTVALAFTAAHFLPHANRTLIALAFAAAGVAIGTLLWKRIGRTSV